MGILLYPEPYSIYLRGTIDRDHRQIMEVPIRGLWLDSFLDTVSHVTKPFYVFRQVFYFTFASQPQAKILASEVRIGSGEQLGSTACYEQRVTIVKTQEPSISQLRSCMQRPKMSYRLKPLKVGIIGDLSGTFIIGVIRGIL